jgi:hypothetical protein
MKRLFLIATTAAFLAWIGWLAYTVSRAGTVPIVSRAQLTAATQLLVIDITLDNDLPRTKARVREVIPKPDQKPDDVVKAGDEVEIANLAAALMPGGKAIPGPGTYLVPVVRTGEKTFRIAGLPASPGYPAAVPERPLIYPWVEEVKVQLRSLGIPK